MSAAVPACDFLEEDMLKQTVAILVIAAMTSLSLTASAASQADQPAQSQPDQAIKIKAKVQKIGAGEKAKVRVKLRDGTELRGYVSSIGNDSFSVTDSGARKASSLSYADVASVKGKGLSTAAKVLIVTGIGLGIVVAIVAIHGVHPNVGI
jgi:hypothetical protein